MFGMGLTELILIAIVGIIALGPEKLPDAMVKMAKMFNKLKSLLNDAKDTLDEQVHLEEIQKDMETYKERLEETNAEIMRVSGADKAKSEMSKLDTMLNNESDELEQEGKKKKKKKRKKKENKTVNEDLDKKDIENKEDKNV